MSTLLFVYGTLKRGERNHHLLASEEFVCDTSTSGRYRLHDRGRYPCLVAVTEVGAPVRGEVWRVSAECLQRLDRFEEVPKLFRRERIDVRDVEEPVWAYFFQGEIASLPLCGPHWSRTKQLAAMRPVHAPVSQWFVF